MNLFCLHMAIDHLPRFHWFGFHIEFSTPLIFAIFSAKDIFLAKQQKIEQSKTVFSRSFASYRLRMLLKNGVIVHKITKYCNHSVSEQGFHPMSEQGFHPVSEQGFHPVSEQGFHSMSEQSFHPTSERVSTRSTTLELWQYYQAGRGSSTYLAIAVLLKSDSSTTNLVVEVVLTWVMEVKPLGSTCLKEAIFTLFAPFSLNFFK